MPPRKFISRLEQNLVGIIGDSVCGILYVTTYLLKDTVTGFLLCGIGNVDASRKKNFFVVTAKTHVTEIEDAFREMTTRGDISILLITQAVANEIRPQIDAHESLSPAIVEIPSKDHPYDPSRDWIMQKVKGMFSAER